MSAEGRTFRPLNCLTSFSATTCLPDRHFSGENATTILRRQTLSAFTSAYVKQISSYPANGCETMITEEQSAQSKAI